MKKKIILLTLCFSVLLSIFSFTAYASDDTFTYYIADTQPLVITGESFYLPSGTTVLDSNGERLFFNGVDVSNCIVKISNRSDGILYLGSYPYGSSYRDFYFKANKGDTIISNTELSPSFFETFVIKPLSKVSSKDFSSVLSKLSEQINVLTIVEALVVIVGACVCYVFMCWGVHKLIKAIMSAFKKGKVSI